MKDKVLQIGKFVFFISLGVFIIWLFQRQLTPEEKTKIIDSFYTADYFYILLAAIITLLANLLRAVVWRMLLQPMNFHPGLNKTFGAVTIGYFANLAFPRFGEVLRCVILNRYDGIPTQKSIGTVIVERVLDMLVFAVIFAAVCILQFSEVKDYMYTRFGTGIEAKFGDIPVLLTILYIFIGTALILGIFFLIFRKRIIKNTLYQKIARLFKDFLTGLKSIRDVKKPLLLIVCCIGIWLLYFLSTYVACFSITETSHLPLMTVLTVFVISSFGMMITPGGIGLYPVLVAESLAIFGVLKASGYALGWILWSSQTIVYIAAGLFYLILFPIIYKKHKYII